MTTTVLGPFYVGDNPATSLVISVTRDGEAVDLSGYNAVEVLVVDGEGNDVDWVPVPPATIDDLTDTVTVPFPASSPFATAGIYTMRLRLFSLSTDAEETSQALYLNVLSDAEVETWATITDVYNITGEIIEQTDLILAQEVIENHVGRTTDASNSFRTRDLIWLKKAVAYQATWQRMQPGYQERHAVKEVVQDGTQIVYAHSAQPLNTAVIMLAPLAQRAIKNLSWMGSRSIRLRPARPHADERVLLSNINYKSDDNHLWYPLPGGFSVEGGDQD